MITALMKGVPYLLQSAVTSGNGAVVMVPITCNKLDFFVVGAGTISGGALSIEEAYDPDYTGTWSVIQAITLTSITAGAIVVVHVEGTFRAVRARVSTPVTGGGTVTVYAMSN